ncbi:helix-turn-helix transcriptional regulator [uncultured Draconibacterium sp.]|uniref:helix-turn-helix domain-containing protein n=1 Tax=uncultured Draconibacterium sp. TaxID=1573823 RepID=UPI0026023558|nr:helix-turn-helix transcriptional regulator [uncultured Draconibacterium sp.]
MKRFYKLGEFLVDYRKHRKLTQLDFAAMMDVDVRTVIRWENNDSLIKSDKEKLLVEDFGVPHQLIRNLNTNLPMPVYFDFKKWMYSLTLLSNVVRNAEDFKTEITHETSRIDKLELDRDFNFISYIQENQKNKTPIRQDVVKTAAKLLPELNLVIRDHSGYHGGHLAILPLKYEAYGMLRDRKKEEHQLTMNDLSRHFDEDPMVFYFYSIYSNSTDNNFYLVNKLLFYFKERQLNNYIFAGTTYQELKVERFREMGFNVIWERILDDHPDQKATFLSGNFNEFLSK